MKPIRILLADDHSILREGLRLLIAPQSDMEVVGEACDGFETLEKARKLQPQVIVIDIAMPRMNGIETISLLKDCCPDCRTVVLSGYEKDAYIHEALKAGATAYIVKGAPSSELLEAIRCAAQGKAFLANQVQQTVIRSYLKHHDDKPKTSEFDRLSDREQQVFRLLVEGNTSSQIADILCISPKTVDKHRAAITHKLGIDNPVKMVQYAIRTGLIDPELWEK